MSAPVSKRFQTTWYSTLAMLIAVAICLSLSHWQSGRVEEKKALEARYQQMQQAPALDLNNYIASHEDAPNSLSELIWQPIKVRGEFLQDQQFLLDSQSYRGQAGYNVISPLQLEGRSEFVLVNRGWIPAGPDRKIVPKIPKLTEGNLIQGQLAKPNPALPGFEAIDINERVQLFVDIDAISAKLAAPVLPMLIQLDERALGELPREWPKYQAKIEMHEFYVAHWLIAAVIALLIYIYFGFKGKKTSTDKKEEIEAEL